MGTYTVTAGKNISYIRMVLGCSIRSIANCIDVSPRTVRRWLTNSARPVTYNSRLHHLLVASRYIESTGLLPIGPSDLALKIRNTYTLLESIEYGEDGRIAAASFVSAVRLERYRVETLINSGVGWRAVSSQQGAHWHPAADTELRKMWQDHVPDWQIGRLLGRTARGVRSRAKALGLPLRNTRGGRRQRGTTMKTRTPSSFIKPPNVNQLMGRR